MNVTFLPVQASCDNDDDCFGEQFCCNGLCHIDCECCVDGCHPLGSVCCDWGTCGRGQVCCGTVEDHQCCNQCCEEGRSVEL